MTMLRPLYSAALWAFVILAGAGDLAAQSASVKITVPDIEEIKAKAKADAIASAMEYAWGPFGESIGATLEAKFQSPRPGPVPRGPIIINKGDNNEDRLYQAGTR